MYHQDNFVVLETNQPEQFLTALELLEKLKQVLEKFQFQDLPPDLQKFSDLALQAQYLLDTSCQLDVSHWRIFTMVCSPVWKNSPELSFYLVYPYSLCKIVINDSSILSSPICVILISTPGAKYLVIFSCFCCQILIGISGESNSKINT